MLNLSNLKSFQLVKRFVSISLLVVIFTIATSPLYAFASTNIVTPPVGPFNNNFVIKKFLEDGFYNSYDMNTEFPEDYINLSNEELKLPEHYLIFRMQTGNSSSPVVGETSKGHTQVKYLIYDLQDKKTFNLNYSRNGTSPKNMFSTSDDFISKYIIYSSSFSLDEKTGIWVPKSSITEMEQKFIEMPIDCSLQYNSALVYSNVKDLEIVYKGDKYSPPDFNPQNDDDSSFDHLRHGQFKKVSPKIVVSKNGQPTHVEFTYNFKMTIALMHENSLAYDIAKYSRMITDSLLISVNGISVPSSDVQNVSVSYTQNLSDPSIMNTLLLNNTVTGTLKFTIPVTNFKDLNNVIVVNTNCYTHVDKIHTPLEELSCRPDYINLSSTSEFSYRNYTDIDEDGKDDNTGETIEPGDNTFDDLDKPPTFPTMPDTLNPIDWVKWLIDVILWFIQTCIYYVLSIFKLLVSSFMKLINTLSPLASGMERLFGFLPSPFAELLVTTLSVSLVVGFYKMFRR